MVNERDAWFAYADTVEHVPVPKEQESSGKVKLAALTLEKAKPESNENGPPASAIREIPAQLTARDARTDKSPIPPLEIEVDLD